MSQPQLWFAASQLLQLTENQASHHLPNHRHTASYSEWNKRRVSFWQFGQQVGKITVSLWAFSFGLLHSVCALAAFVSTINIQFLLLTMKNTSLRAKTEALTLTVWSSCTCYFRTDSRFYPLSIFQFLGHFGEERLKATAEPVQWRISWPGLNAGRQQTAPCWQNNLHVQVAWMSVLFQSSLPFCKNK